MAMATREEMLRLASAFEEQANSLPTVSIFGDVNDLEGMRMAGVLCRKVALNLNDKEWLESKREFFVRLLDEFADNDLLYERYDTQLGVLDFALGLDRMMYNDMVEE